LAAGQVDLEYSETKRVIGCWGTSSRRRPDSEAAV
jgi:hypothetical protein